MSNSRNHNCVTTQRTFVGRLTRSLPLSRPNGLPVYVARVPAAPFCETPTKQVASAAADALQFSHGMIGPIRHLYVHIPFCARICPYCAFYKDLLDRSQTSRFCEAVLRELELLVGTSRCGVRSAQSADLTILPSTIYFGGGTPTALTTAQLEFLLEGFRRRLDLSSVEEWTMEANPGSVSARKAALLRKLDRIDPSYKE